MTPKSNDDDELCQSTATSEKSLDNGTLFEDQYDHELEKTLKVLDEIKDTDAVTQADLDDFIRGLGGKPDGLDLKKTNIREWKSIFLEHWLDLNNLSSKKGVTTTQLFFAHVD